MPDIQVRISHDWFDMDSVEHFLMSVIRDIKEKGLYTVERADEVAEQRREAIRSGRLIVPNDDDDNDLPW